MIEKNYFVGEKEKLLGSKEYRIVKIIIADDEKEIVNKIQRNKIYRKLKFWIKWDFGPQTIGTMS